MIVPGSKKAVLRGPFGNFEVLNRRVLHIFFLTSPKGPEVRWYTRAGVKMFLKPVWVFHFFSTFNLTSMNDDA